MSQRLPNPGDAELVKEIEDLEVEIRDVIRRLVNERRPGCDGRLLAYLGYAASTAMAEWFGTALDHQTRSCALLDGRAGIGSLGRLG